MTENITITLNKRAAVVLLSVLALHAFMLTTGSATLEAWHRAARERWAKLDARANIPAPIHIRTIGVKNGSRKNSVLVTPKTVRSPSKGDPFKTAAAMNDPLPRVRPRPPQRSDSLSARQAAPTRTGQLPRARLGGFTQPAQSVQQVAAQVRPGGAAAVPYSPLLSKSAINMHVEVPEGVAEGELNEYELKFYGFQKRMMEKYLSAIMLQVREFERKYPHKSLVPEGRHIMTGRVTFDSDGNIQQIKMVRWTQAEGLQELFNEVLKAMDSVPNPPRPLWEKQGEFTVFYNLTVNNG